MLSQDPFSITLSPPSILWHFQLAPPPVSPQSFDYNSLPDTKRTLSLLIQDINSQLQSKIQLQQQNQNLQQSAQQQGKQEKEVFERAKRKLAKKLLKKGEVKLSTFANEIGQDKEEVRKFFLKKEMDVQEKEKVISGVKSYLQNQLLNTPLDTLMPLLKQFTDGYFPQEQNDDIYLVLMDGYEPYSKQIPIESNQLISIDLNLTVHEDRAITDTFLWPPDKTKDIDIYMFTKYLLEDLLIEYDITVTEEEFKGLHEETRVQLRTQLQYKSLLQKYKTLLLSFSQSCSDPKQYLIPIQIRLLDNDGDLIYSDDLQWDLMNQSNNVELFCEILIQDQQIPREYLSQLSQQIRTQMYNELNWRFTCMGNVFRGIVRERELPKLKNQASGQIKRNIVYAMDGPMVMNFGERRESEDEESGESGDGENTRPVDFHNSQMYNLISRNYDLLPREYQKLISMQVQQQPLSPLPSPHKHTHTQLVRVQSYDNQRQRDYDDREKEKIKRKMDMKTRNSLVKVPFKLEGNPYLPGNLISQFDVSRVKSVYSELVEEAKREM